ncbi:MAG: response regulator [Planctomycetota bacterium]
MSQQRVLVVDDEESIRELLTRFLEAGGYAVETAPDGVSALEAFERNPADVVVTDLTMPRMGGVDLVRRIKAKAPQTIAIVLTGYASLDSAVGVLHEGCDDYLLKPLSDIAIVTHTIEKCLDRRRAIALAASHLKISQAKDNLLGLVVGEFEGRIAEMRVGVDRIRAIPNAPESEREAAKLGELVDRLQGLLQAVRTAAQTVRARGFDEATEERN